MWYLVFVRARNTSPAKRVGNLKEKDPHRLVRDRAWLALRSVGAGARACPRHPFARAACARVACTVTLCLVGARARASVPGTHIVRGGPVLGQARVFPALGHAHARARCVLQGCTRVRCQRKHCLPCHGPAVCPEFDTRLLGITAGMRGSREGSGAKAAKSTRVVR